MKNDILVIWEKGPVTGGVDVAHGELASVRIAGGKGKATGATFSVDTSGEVRLFLKFSETNVKAGGCATRVMVQTKTYPFTFFLRDVNSACPIFVPEYGVIVTAATDHRSYAEIVKAIRRKGLVSQLAAIEHAPEESFEEACKGNLNLVCPTWLGLSRDMRFFEVNYQTSGGYWGYVRSRYHSTLQMVPETENKPYSLHFMIGPGSSCRPQITRRLEEGILPILHSTQQEDDIRYEVTVFSSLETQPVTAGNLRGSDWQACYPNTHGYMLKPEEKAALSGLVDQEMRQREEETVCWVRVEACNQGEVPRYAWFGGMSVVRDDGKSESAGFDGKTGFGQFQTGRVFGVHRLDGKPAPNQELAVLVQPGAKVVYEILVPHQPLSAARARALARQDFQQHLEACRLFWKGKLKNAAAISIPEPAVDERVKAGLLHCDLVALGKESGGPVLATIGWYSPIGSESAPIIQFFDSMGWHALARRANEFFLARQREDGFIQNFNGYQLETGAALWTMGEHYRYTGDKAWVRRFQPKLLKACEYLLAWREWNKTPELKGKGYGLLDGKVADPEDFFHSFMLNGLSYLGIQRVSEMLEEVNPVQARRLAKEAQAFRQDIRTAFHECIGRSPVIPLGDGTWVSTVPPWTEYPGALGVFAEGGNWMSHRAFGSRDSLCGSLYLVISEVLDADELAADILLRSHQQLFTVKNAGLSQPYYCRHDLIHLLRGEVKPFLKTYYNQFSALQDRETYSFWEHYWFASQHKTHEEAWFLMQTRWMLLLEEGSTLNLLRGIPRAWLGDGKRLAFEGMKTYFGAVSLEVVSHVETGVINVSYTLDQKRKPAKLVVRLPHPEGLRPREVEGGIYRMATESVEIRKPKNRGVIQLRF